MRRFRLQYASNLFITRHHAPVFPHFLQPAAPTLALVGNIGNPEDPRHEHFFQWAAKYWDTILYVPGQLEYPNQPILYDCLKHLTNIHILTNTRPFFMFKNSPIALWTPETHPSTTYRKLFLFSHKCHEQRVYLEHHGTIYSHGLNGRGKDVYTNSRGEEESPSDGYNKASIIDVQF